MDTSTTAASSDTRGAHTPVSSRIEDALFTKARQAPERTAILDGDDVVPYASLADRAARLAAMLRREGLAAGDRAAVYLDKTVDSVVALYAVWTAGGIAVPVNETLRSRQVDHILRHSGSRVLISSELKLSRIEGPHQDIRVLRVDDGPFSESLEPTPCGAGVEAAAILYTSGSTGLPKGILLSHQNLVAGTRIVAGYLGIREDERILSVLPFSFDYGLNQLLTAVATGAALVLQRSHLPADICRTLDRHAVTAMAAVPPLWNQLVQDHSPFFRMSPPPRLRYMTNSGGALAIDTIRRYRELLPETRIYLMYGLSEAFRSTYLPPEEVDRRPESIGRAIPETEIHVLDADGRECATDEAGELVHCGPTVALGYWRDPGATAAVFRPSPFAPPGSGETAVYSGDLVKRDAEGFLYFVGRRDQLIKSLGYRVSPDEVEATLFASGLLAEAAVHGEPDPIAGHAIVADVVPRSPQTFSPEDLLAYCRREMPRYMIPKSIRVHDALPRTASGKLDRKSLVA